MGKRGELGGAIKHYREAVRIDPTYVNAVFNLGSVMSKRGELGRRLSITARRCGSTLLT